LKGREKGICSKKKRGGGGKKCQGEGEEEGQGEVGGLRSSQKKKGKEGATSLDNA